jgi:hypothetical protein
MYSVSSFLLSYFSRVVCVCLLKIALIYRGIKIKCNFSPQ